MDHEEASLKVEVLFKNALDLALVKNKEYNVNSTTVMGNIEFVDGDLVMITREKDTLAVLRSDKSRTYKVYSIGNNDEVRPLIEFNTCDDPSVVIRLDLEGLRAFKDISLHSMLLKKEINQLKNSTNNEVVVKEIVGEDKNNINNITTKLKNKHKL